MNGNSYVLQMFGCKLLLHKGSKVMWCTRVAGVGVVKFKRCTYLKVLKIANPRVSHCQAGRSGGEGRVREFVTLGQTYFTRSTILAGCFPFVWNLLTCQKIHSATCSLHWKCNFLQRVCWNFNHRHTPATRRFNSLPCPLCGVVDNLPMDSTDTINVECVCEHF